MVVVTALHSFAMPFIRYRLGDLVTRGVDACPCGQSFAVIGAALSYADTILGLVFIVFVLAARQGIVGLFRTAYARVRA